MDLHITVFVSVFILIAGLVVALSFWSGKKSVAGELKEGQEARLALGFYEKYVRVQESGTAKQARRLAESIEGARDSMSRKDYDILVMKAWTLAKKLEECEVPMQIRRVR